MSLVVLDGPVCAVSFGPPRLLVEQGWDEQPLSWDSGHRPTRVRYIGFVR